jgi:hypothetical protein
MLCENIYHDNIYILVLNVVGCSEKKEFVDMAEANRDSPVVKAEPQQNEQLEKEDQPNMDELLAKLKGFGGGGAKVFTADDIKNMNFDDIARGAGGSGGKKDRKNNKRKTQSEKKSKIDPDLGADETIEL